MDSFRSQLVGYIFKEEDILMAVDFFSSEVINKQYLLNVEYKVGGVDYVTLSESVSKEDIAQQLISEGLVQAEARKEKHLKEVVDKYKKAEEQAKKSRVIYSLNDCRFIFDMEAGTPNLCVDFQFTMAISVQQGSVVIYPIFLQKFLTALKKLDYKNQCLEKSGLPVIFATYIHNFVCMPQMHSCHHYRACIPMQGLI